MAKVNLEDYRWVSKDYFTDPPSGHAIVYKNVWWVVDKHGNYAIYKKYYPQCNISRTIVEKAILPRTPQGVGIEFVPIAILPDDPQRYL